jgi:hypothetical protein
VKREGDFSLECGLLAAALVFGKSLDGGKAKRQQASRTPK